jgi:hypothetical protein
MFLEQKIKDPVQIFRHTMGQRKATLEEKTKKNPFRDTKSCTSANSFPQSHEDTKKKKKKIDNDKNDNQIQTIQSLFKTKPTDTET